MAILSGLMAFFAVLLFFVSPIGLFRPSIIWLANRRQVLALWLFSLVVLGFAIDLDPVDPEAGPIGFPLLVIWLILSGAGALIFWSRRKGARSMSAVEGEADREKVEAEIRFLSGMRERADLARKSSRRSPPRKQPTKRATPPRRASRTPATSDPRWEDGEQGGFATFTYVDADGVVTDREVAHWFSRGPHLHAFCLDRGASRTFRKDCIEDWSGG